MGESTAPRVIETVLRCYPARWRRRHGEEAAELAMLLIRDGTSAGSIAWSYLGGAARAWLTSRLRMATCALLVVAGSLGVSAGLLGSTVPARAAITGQQQPLSKARPEVRPRVPCQVGPVVVPALVRPWTARVVSGVAGHGRSC